MPPLRVVEMWVTACAFTLLVGAACAGGRQLESVVKLHVNDGGSGDVPVVFLHSLAGHSGQFAAQLGHLRQTRRAVALDLRGHGRSAAPEDANYSIAAMARDVAATVDTLALERVVLVGHSMGGLVAAAYAAEHPQRVAGLLLLDPSGDARKVPPNLMARFFAELESDYTSTAEKYWEGILAGSRASVRDSVMAALRATPRPTVVGVFRALILFDPAEALLRYGGSTLSVITPLNTGPMTLHALVPALPTRTVTGTGHWLHMDKPDEINGIVDEFLKAVGR